MLLHPMFKPCWSLRSEKRLSYSLPLFMPGKGKG